MTEFQKAAAAARRRYADDVWFTLTVNEQAKAIYAELRRIDAERVNALLRRRDVAGPTRLRNRQPAAREWTPAAEA